MTRRLMASWPTAVLFAGAVLLAALSGCRSTASTFPSYSGWEEDVTYFPAGPEFELANQVQSSEPTGTERSGGGTKIETATHDRAHEKIRP